jgi:uncharacterized SAM-binding protein YcdF (DUF218 family)
MIYLHKILPAIASPIITIIALFIISMFARSRWIQVATIATVLISTNPIIAGLATAHLERDFPPTQIASIDNINTVIVLSGMLTPIATQNGDILYEFNSAVDRIEAGIVMMQSGQAKRMILTRGQVPWSAGEPEGEFLMRYAVARGIAPQKITLTGIAANTEDEARQIAGMVSDGESVGVITSAFHMPRAMQVFRAHGIDPLPIAVDYRQGSGRLTFMDFIPSSGALDDVSIFAREMIGRAYYHIKF